MTTSIYALIDPRTQECKYIGKTQRLRARLQDHLTIKNNTPRYEWISELIQANLKPETAVLEELPQDADWQEKEREWIAYFRFIGADLTNRTGGGFGTAGHRHSEKTRKQMSATRTGYVGYMRGRTHLESTKEKIRAANVGRTSPMLGRQHSEETKAKMRAAQILRREQENLNKLLDTKPRRLYKELNTEIEEEAMTAPSNEAIITEYLATRERIRAIRAKAEELVAQQETFQANRETYLLQQDDPALVDFFTDLFLNGRDGKATAESKKKDLGLKQAEIEKWLLKVLDKLKLTGIKTLHGTVYPTRKESVSVEDWDAFLEAEILGPMASPETIYQIVTCVAAGATPEEVVQILRSAAHLEFINKGVNKTSVLERMGDKDEKNDSRPNPPPSGIKYTALRTVGVRKS